MVKVIIHCSASDFGNAALIDSWHRARGFAMIGYHYVILNGKLSPHKFHSYFDGHIETGRPLDDDSDLELDEKGAHTWGYNHAVGICLIGESGKFTNAQMGSLHFLIRKLREQFKEIEVGQHSDYDPVNKPWCAGLSKLQMNVLNMI